VPEETPGKKIHATISSAYYTDLNLVILWLVAGIASIYVPVLNTLPLRIILTLPLVLFIPGYGIIAALYPKKRDIELLERIALSFGLSIAVIPVIGFGLNFTPWGIRLDPIVLSLSLFTFVMILAAYYRRSLVVEDERFRFPFSDVALAGKKELVPQGRSRVDHVLGAILLLLIFSAIISTIFVFTAPKGEEEYSEFYVLDENRTASNFPSRINVSQNYPIHIGIGNHENRNVIYTIETWTLRTEFDNITNTSRIVAMEPNDRMTFTLADRKTAIIPYNLSVKETGYDRVEFLLFNESIPGFEVTGRDRINASYRNLHLWLTVRVGQNPEDQVDITEG
jgi:uncharacterized membrane protein